MKKICYILISLAIVSCAKDKSKNMEAITVEAAEVNYEIADDKTYLKADNGTKEFLYENIASQKLLDLYDLSLLQKRHPEFKEDINAQLKELTADSIVVNNYRDKVSIQNIHQDGPLTRVSDSVQEMKLYFNIVSNGTITADSIYVKIISKTITLEDKNMITSKIRFSKSEFKH